MLDKLIDLILSSLQLIWPLAVIDEYERGIVLRLGRFNRDLQSGLHWLWPFGIETILKTNVCVETVDLEPQSLTTKDTLAVVFRASVSFSVTDARKFLLEVENASSVIQDAATGHIYGYVRKRTLHELYSTDLGVELCKLVRRKAERFGVCIESIDIKDFQQCRTHRLMTKG